jgi:hypothetical protein
VIFYMNIFGSDHTPNNGPRSGANAIAPGRGVRVEFGKSRSWDGLRERTLLVDLNRVAVRIASRWGVDKSGTIVAIDWLSPQFFSAQKARLLVESGRGKYCSEEQS